MECQILRWTSSIGRLRILTEMLNWDHRISSQHLPDRSSPCHSSPVPADPLSTWTVGPRIAKLLLPDGDGDEVQSGGRVHLPSWPATRPSPCPARPPGPIDALPRPERVIELLLMKKPQCLPPSAPSSELEQRRRAASHSRRPASGGGAALPKLPWSRPALVW